MLAGYESVPTSTQEFATAIAIHTDGKIVAAGSAGIFNGVPNYVGLALARHNGDGTLDPAFGAGGKVITENAHVSAMTIQSDGRIIVAGAFPAVAPAFGLARYDLDGKLDMTFGNGGIVTTNFFNFPDSYFECSAASALAIQSDGKIVATGMMNFGWLCASDFALARYNNDSSPSVISMGFDRACVRREGSFTVTFTGSSLSHETYFDLRFRLPDSSEDQVALNWQRGSSAQHLVPAGTSPGVWIITGVRAHRSENDSRNNFIPLETRIMVSPSSCAD